MSLFCPVGDEEGFLPAAAGGLEGAEDAAAAEAVAGGNWEGPPPKRCPDAAP